MKFVLVHGSGGGAWAWDGVRPLLDRPGRAARSEARQIPRSYVPCRKSGFGQTAERARAAGGDYHELEAGHMAMEAAPRQVAALLSEIAAPDDLNVFEAVGWEAKATGYDEFVGQITPRLIAPLLDAAAVRQGVRVLDVASGPGYVTAGAAQRGASVVGVDVAESMLDVARERYPQLDFRLGNAEALPFPDASFDAVVGNFATHHLGRPEHAAGEFARVLAPAGRLALSGWDFPEERASSEYSSTRLPRRGQVHRRMFPRALRSSASPRSTKWLAFSVTKGSKTSK